jgi:hypothetical protein
LNTAMTVARSNARGFLTTARDVFKKLLGSQPSAAWAAPGWSSQSIAVPSTSDLILPLLGSVKNYLTTNPAYENAPLEVTTKPYPTRAARSTTRTPSLGSAKPIATPAKNNSANDCAG